MSNTSTVSRVQRTMLPKTTTATSFALFPSFAPELRLKIWASACFPRTVSIRYLPSLDKCVSSSSPPSVLHVCHEAREEALRMYSLSFATRSNPGRTYFDPCRDTLYLPRHMAMGYDETSRDFRTLISDEREILDQVRRIAIDHVDVEVKRPWESYNKASLIRSFKQVEEVILVLRQRDGADENWKRIFEFVRPREKLEEVVQFWVHFRQGFLLEERRLEVACGEAGKEYKAFLLPNVRMRSRVLI